MTAVGLAASDTVSGRGRLASVLAAFCRRQAKISAVDVATDAQCLALIDEILEAIGDGSSVEVKSRVGRKQIHNRAWAESALLDILRRDPDGLPESKAETVRRLRGYFESASRKVPGDSWLKSAVRRFYDSTVAFESAAIERYRSSEALQRVFDSEAQYLAFRRNRRGLEEEWRASPVLRERYDSAEKFFAAMMDDAAL